MHILVTGGAGFIGSHLCERLLKDSHSVDVIDDLSTGDIKNISGFMDNERFRFIHDSVINESMMHTLIEKCDTIYHLAAAVGVDLIVKKPVWTIETNIRGTEVVLDVAKKFRRNVLLASTSEVYGKNEKVPFKEDDDSLFGATIYSRWSYACSKAIDEFLGLAYHKQYSVPVIIMRLFNTVGERQTGQYGMVIPRFVRAALTGEPITIYGDGEQSRCFTYVKDVIEGMVALVNDPGAYGHVYNIGSTEEISIKDLAKKVKKIAGSTSEIVYLPYEKAYGEGFDDMRRRIPSLDKIYKQVGYKPTTSLDDILRKIVEYFRKEVLI